VRGGVHAFQLDYRDFVKVDARYFRPTEVDVLLADARKAREVLAGSHGALQRTG